MISQIQSRHFLGGLMCVTTFAVKLISTAYATSGKADVYIVQFPRDGDAITMGYGT